MSTPSIRRLIEAQGGTVQDTHDGYAVSFPEEPQAEPMHATGKDIEEAVQRAKDFGTTVARLWRERGDGWYAASSHEEHLGFSYVCQIDERTGRPRGCECCATVTCHHLGAAIAEFRRRVGWEENDAAVLAEWEQLLSRAQRISPQEEQWT